MLHYLQANYGYNGRQTLRIDVVKKPLEIEKQFWDHRGGKERRAERRGLGGEESSVSIVFSDGTAGDGLVGVRLDVVGLGGVASGLRESSEATEG